MAAPLKFLNQMPEIPLLYTIGMALIQHEGEAHTYAAPAVNALLQDLSP
jgi:hypothetical protein